MHLALLLLLCYTMVFCHADAQTLDLVLIMLHKSMQPHVPHVRAVQYRYSSALPQLCLPQRLGV